MKYVISNKSKFLMKPVSLRQSDKICIPNNPPKKLPKISAFYLITERFAERGTTEGQRLNVIYGEKSSDNPMSTCRSRMKFDREFPLCFLLYTVIKKLQYLFICIFTLVLSSVGSTEKQRTITISSHSVKIIFRKIYVTHFCENLCFL